jgi:hypothetical protein
LAHCTNRNRASCSANGGEAVVIEQDKLHNVFARLYHAREDMNAALKDAIKILGLEHDFCSEEHDEGLQRVIDALEELME